MKSEEREVVSEPSGFQEWLQVGLPVFLKKNGSYVLLVLALALLGWQLWGWHQKKKAAEIETAWGELSAASSPGTIDAPEKLQGVINTYNVKPVQAMAWEQIADFYLQLVAEANPGEAYNGVKIGKKEALAKAEEAANKVIKDYPDQRLAVGKAHLALGAVALDRGEWDAAKKQYELLTEKDGPFAQSAIALQAALQLAHIEDYKKTPRLGEMVVALPAPTTAAGSQPDVISGQGVLTLPSFPGAGAGPTTQAK